MAPVRILIAYESTSADLARIALSLGQGLAARFDVVVKPAREVTAPDVQAAVVFAFGADLCDVMEWASLARIFPGINLSGRSLCLFLDGRESSDPRKTESFFASMIADSGLALVPSDGAADSSWIDALSNIALRQ